MRTNIQPDNILLLLPYITSLYTDLLNFVCPKCNSPHTGSQNGSTSSLPQEGMKDANPGLNKGKHTQAQVSAAVIQLEALRTAAADGGYVWKEDRALDF